jgi:5-(carboxyamino)imidazole ribonucleotide mutase
MAEPEATARVGIVCGSRSDFPVMEKAVELLGKLEIPCELHAISAHRAPDLLFRFVGQARARGIRVFIAGAGGAAHLPGVVAAKTILPVIGVPIATQVAGGLDSLLSIVQMPKGIPVATVAVGGAENAALLAAEILALSDPALQERLQAFRDAQTRSIEDDETNADLRGGR